MDLHDGRQAMLRIHEGAARGGIRDAAHLQPDQRSNEREAVRDPMVHLAKQNGLALDQRFQSMIGGFDRLQGDRPLATELHLLDHLTNGGPQQIENRKDYIRILKAKMSNSAFVKNAPEKVVRAEMDKLHIAENELTKLEEKHKGLSGE